MVQTDQSDPSPSLWLKLSNVLLLLITLILGVVTFFALMEIILTIAANVIVRTSEESFRQSYVLGTIRNFWLLCGGGLLLAFFIGAFEYHSKRLGNTRTRRILIGTLIIELVIIGFNFII